jgi:hypothetical protein
MSNLPVVSDIIRIDPSQIEVLEPGEYEARQAQQEREVRSDIGDALNKILPLRELVKLGIINPHDIALVFGH